MSKKQLSLAATALVALLLAGAATTLLRDTEPPIALPGSSRASELPAALRPSHSPANATPLADVDPLEPVDSAQSSESRSSATGELTYAPTAGRWVVGRVIPPAGVATLDEVEVFALAREATYADFVQRSLPQGAASDADPASGADDDPARGADDDQGGGATGAGIRAQGRVDADGHFRLAVPEDEDTFLMLRGRYLYLPRTRRVTPGDPSPLTLEPLVGACLALEVRSADGAPVGAAHFEFETSTEDEAFNPFLPGPEERVRMQLRAALEQGEFQLAALPVDAQYVLTLLPERWAAQRQTIEGLTALETRRVALTLTPGGRVAGVVVDDAGGPVAGAEVSASLLGAWFGFDDKVVRSATSGADGRFQLEALTALPLTLRADHDEYLDSKKTRLEVAEGERREDITLTLEAGKVITGRVAHPGGEPAAGLEVAASFDPAFLAGPSAFNALRGAKGKAQTDAEGRFRLAGLGAGPFVLQCETKGSADATLRARRDNVLPGAEDLLLVLHPPIGVYGRVRDVDGQALTAFRIEATRQVESAMGNMSLDSRAERYEAAEDGLFFLADLIEGTWNLYAIADTHRSAEGVTVSLPTDTEQDPLLLVVTPTATVTGIVLDPDGRPVPRAQVVIDTGQPAWAGVMSGAPDPPEAASAEDGTFVLEGVLPGTVALAASSERHARGQTVSIEVAPGEQVDGVELRLILGGHLTGVVYDDEGKLASDMFIVVNSMTMEQRMATTDSRGAFEFEALLPGTWQVIAMDRGADWSGAESGNLGDMMKSMKMSQADVRDGEQTHVVIGAPPADPILLHGRVTHDGEPYSQAMITLYPQGEKLYERLKFTEIDARGEYRLLVDGPGEYVAIVQRLGGGPGQQQNVEFSREIPQQEDFRLDFEMPLGRVSGRVFAPGKTPCPSARITLSPAGGFRSDALLGGQYAEIQTGPDGAYDLVALRPGKYTLSAGGAAFFNMGSGEARYGRVTREVEVREDQWLEDVDFELQAPGSVEVTVVDSAGAPVRGAYVFVRNEAGRILEPFSMFQTDGAGRFEQQGLTPGEYTITARQGALVSLESAPVRVAAETRSKIQLRVDEGSILWVRITDEDGPARASVRVVDSSGREWGGMFGMDDLQLLYLDQGFSPTEQRIGPLPPGDYRVHVEAGELSSIKPVTLRSGEERKLNVRLK